MKLITRYSLLKTNSAVAALPTILLIGGIIVEIGIAAVFIVYFLGQSGFGARLSAEALAAAEAGIQDGIFKVVRNQNIDFSSSGSPYTITVGTRSAQISIYKDTPSVGKDQIISIGTAFNKQRKLQAILNVNSTTGEVGVESIQEIPF